MNLSLHQRLKRCYEHPQSKPIYGGNEAKHRCCPVVGRNGEAMPGSRWHVIKFADMNRFLLDGPCNCTKEVTV